MKAASVGGEDAAENAPEDVRTVEVADQSSQQWWRPSAMGSKVTCCFRCSTLAALRRSEVVGLELLQNWLTVGDAATREERLLACPDVERQRCHRSARRAWSRALADVGNINCRLDEMASINRKRCLNQEHRPQRGGRAAQKLSCDPAITSICLAGSQMQTPGEKKAPRPMVRQQFHRIADGGKMERNKVKS
jgi:hypothetical protein